MTNIDPCGTQYSTLRHHLVRHPATHHVATTMPLPDLLTWPCESQIDSSWHARTNAAWPVLMTVSGSNDYLAGGLPCQGTIVLMWPNRQPASNGSMANIRPNYQPVSAIIDCFRTLIMTVLHPELPLYSGRKTPTQAGSENLPGSGSASRKQLF